MYVERHGMADDLVEEVLAHRGMNAAGLAAVSNIPQTKPRCRPYYLAGASPHRKYHTGTIQ